MEKVISKWIHRLDEAYIRFDKKFIYRTKNLRLIPGFSFREGGKKSYGEWCHVIGIFQTLLFSHLKEKTGNHILDVGCGTGLMAIATEPFIFENGRYLGVDVGASVIEFCKKHYLEDYYAFTHLDVYNGLYAVHQQAEEKKKWASANESMDAVTALSVWTHLIEEDALFYFREIERVLKPEGVAIITFFNLDEEYYQKLHQKGAALGKYHQTRQDLWVFNRRCQNSTEWFCQEHAENEETAIAITTKGIEKLIEKTNLKIEKIYQGNWKENPGTFFQDIFVFRKSI